VNERRPRAALLVSFYFFTHNSQLVTHYSLESFAVSGMLDGMEVLERIDHHPDLSGNKMAGNRTPHAGVGTVITVVAHYEIFVFTERPLEIGGGRNVNVRLLQQHPVGIGFVVDGNLPVTYFHRFAGSGDDALDKGNGDILRPLKDNDIAPMRLAEMIGDLIDDDVFIVVEIGFHRGAGDVERLDEEKADHKGHAQHGGDGFENIVSEQRGGNKNGQPQTAARNALMMRWFVLSAFDGVEHILNHKSVCKFLFIVQHLKGSKVRCTIGGDYGGG